MLVINLFIDIAVNLEVGITCAAVGGMGGAVIRQVWEHLKPHPTDTCELSSRCRPRPDRTDSTGKGRMVPMSTPLSLHLRVRGARRDCEARR